MFNFLSEIWYLFIFIKVSLYTDPNWLCKKLCYHEKHHSYLTIMTHANLVGGVLNILSFTNYNAETDVPETRSLRELSVVL